MNRSAVLAAAIAAGAAVLPATASAASPASRAAAYLVVHQGRSGCIGDENTSAWSAIALAAAGRIGPARRAATCVSAHVAGVRTATDRELAILAVVAVRRNPRRVGGRDLVRELVRSRRGGYYTPGGTTNGAIFGVLALRAAGQPVPVAVIRRLLADQNTDGGFSYYPHGTQSDMTAAGIQALRATGRSCRARPVRRALAALASLRSRDGGYPLDVGDPSNTQSTAWAVQAAAACGRRDLRGLRYLHARQAADGSLSYGPGPFASGRIWPTAQAVPALLGRPLPVR
jgi:hypothetical protein